MAKYKVIKTYKDVELGRVLTPDKDEEVTMTVARAEEIEKAIASRKGFESYGPVLERLDGPKNVEEKADE